MKNRIIISTMVFFLFTTGIIGQELIVPEKKVYSDSTGKLFINKALPVYLRLSTSPEPNTDSYLLQSEKTKKYANPMYFDTEGYNSFRSPSCIDPETKELIWPKQDVTFEVYADSKAPSTKIYLGKVLTVFRNDTFYCGGTTEITLSGTDKTAGVENIYYSIGGNAFVAYQEPIPLKEEKVYSFKYYAIDNVGNMEALRECYIVVDDSNPATKVKIDGDEYNAIISGRSSIRLVAADKYGIKAIYYKLDNMPERQYYVPLSAIYMQQGEHKLTYYSIDNLGNTEVAKEYEFYVDKTPPRIVEEIVGNVFIANGKEFSSGRSKLKLTTIDNKAGVKEIFYSINGAEYEKYEKPFYLNSSGGNLIIKTYAIDNVNNRSNSLQTSDVSSIPYIDLSGPNLSYTYNGPSFMINDTMFITKETTLSVSATDYEAGVKKIDYIIDGEKSSEYSEPISIKKDGVHKVEFLGYDNVENTNKETVILVVDNKGPEIFHRFSIVSEKSKLVKAKKLESYPEHTVLFISATDDFSGYEKMYYSLNDGQEMPCYGSIKNFKPDIAQNIKIRAIDKLGNENSYKLDFFIE